MKNQNEQSKENAPREKQNKFVRRRIRGVKPILEVRSVINDHTQKEIRKEYQEKRLKPFYKISIFR